jgi:hypothetical protein
MVNRRLYVMTVLLLAAGVPSALRAQEDGPAGRAPVLIGIAGHTGWIIPHSRELVDISTSHPYGLELDVGWLLADEQHTRRSGLVARRGVMLHLVDFDAPDLLGRMVSLTPYVEPMIRAQDRVHGSLRMGVGFALLDKPYHPETNPRNLFYSSQLSFTVMVNGYVGCWLGRRWEARAGFNFNHISNGGMKEPNKGMNFPTWSLGAAYSAREFAVQRPLRDQAWREQSRRYMQVVLNGTVKNAPPMEADDGPVPSVLWGAMAVAGRRTGRMSAIGAGTEWVYDGYAAEMTTRDGGSLSAWKGALLAGPELISGRVRFGLWFGAYLYAPAWDGDAVYQRYQLTYTIGRGLLLGTSLKAHRHVADVFDVRLGWLW